MAIMGKVYSLMDLNLTLNYMFILYLFNLHQLTQVSQDMISKLIEIVDLKFTDEKSESL